MTTREQLEAAQQAERAWRAGNVTGVRLTEPQLAELKVLRDEIDRIAGELAQEQFNAIEAPPVVLSVDADATTCRLPRAVLDELLICHEAGLSDQEHVAMALDQPERMLMLKQIFELARRHRQR